MIVLQADSENQFNELAEKLKLNDIDYVYFLEPDMDNAITALATYTDEKYFKHFKKL